MRNRTLSIAALLVAAAGLTACQAPAGTVDGCTPSLLPGAATSQVDVSGDAGSAPEVEFPRPLVADEAQASMTGGSGDRAERGAIVDADYVVYSGKTGTMISTSHEGAATMQASSGLRLTAGTGSVLGEAVECAAEGTRVVLATTIGDLFGPTAASEQLDVTPTDTAIVVLDVTDVHPGRAEGTPRPGQQGMPAIALDGDGRPGVTFPAGPAPEELRTMVSIEGTGDPVAEGDRLLLHYTGIVWETQEVFDSSWESGAPAEFTIDDASLIPGFVDAVVGQPIGSQVVVSIPQELGYDDPATRPASIGEGEHLLFVIDILDRVEPAAQ